MPFQIIRGDITKVKADAIVNTANPMPVFAAGTDRAIYQAAGAEELLAARRRIGQIHTGQAAYTPAFGLAAKYIIHTVGPAWMGGNKGEFEELRSCYDHSLRLAAELGCESIAFPLIATGVYGFPRDRALSIALGSFADFLAGHEMDVTLVVFDRASFEVSENVFREISAFIDDSEVGRVCEQEYGTAFPEPFTPRRGQAAAPKAPPMAAFSAPVRFGAIPKLCAETVDGLDDEEAVEALLTKQSDTFQKRLLSLIDQSGMTDPQVYKRANIDRKHFSKIRCNPDYQPKKKTALAFAVALRLDMEQTRDLLARAGYSLTDASRFDLIVMYYIGKKNFDIYEINATLFHFQQDGLGA